ncbi:MAG TPA: DegV family protein [candidate division Zixibacteria bacterium]|nr:DegV family protein [candidate division Zixibacteria bacterium]
MAKKKLGIVADSTCDMPPDLIKKYEIGIVPLKMVFDNDEVRYQGVDITNERFYQRLIDGEMPTTGAPSPKAFKEVIDKKLEEYEEVLVFCIGNKLSATYSTASMVKKQFYDDRVTVIDTNTLSITISLILLPAVRMLADGASKEEILAFVDKTRPHTQVFGGASTLKYLHKGGRLSRASYLIGSLLHLKPLVSVDEGQVVSPGKVRGVDGLMDHMKTVAGKIAENHLSELVIIGHCANPEKAKEAFDYLKSLPNAPKEVLLWDIGPVIGTHLGPGTIGYVWVGEFKEEWVKTKIDLRFWKSDDEKEN